jgi:hypothetical protein
MRLSASASLVAAALAIGCGSSSEGGSRALIGDEEVTFDIPITGVDEPSVGDAAATPGDAGDAGGASLADAGARDGGAPGCASYAAGALYEATSDVNLRRGPATSEAVLEVVPTGSVVSITTTGCAVGGFIPVRHQGVSGWSFASYYRPYTPPAADAGAAGTPGAFTRDDAIERARQSVGFGYWWGHGRWRREGIRPEWKGTCTGSCPNCTYAGSYGADCSGMVAKAWKVPAWNDDVSVDKHPFGTIHFVAANSLWRDVSRSSLVKADALVYNTNGAGHIILYESGDGWGSVYAYECKGCSSGCVRNLRSVASQYKGIRRTGF